MIPISQNSTVTLGIVGAIIITLISCVLWLSNLNSNVTSNSYVISSLQAKMEQMEISNSNVIDRMARIETKLDILIEKAN